MMKMLAILLLLAPLPCLAQTAQMTQTSPAPPPGAPSAPGAAADQAYKQAMMQMQQSMNAPPTGDPDRDFVAGMIPHHQGAIAMAKIELQYGRNAQLRHLAQDIITAQRREIAFMQLWQRRHAPK